MRRTSLLLQYTSYHKGHFLSFSVGGGHILSYMYYNVTSSAERAPEYPV